MTVRSSILANEKSAFFSEYTVRLPIRSGPVSLPALSARSVRALTNVAPSLCRTMTQRSPVPLSIRNWARTTCSDSLTRSATGTGKCGACSRPIVRRANLPSSLPAILGRSQTTMPAVSAGIRSTRSLGSPFSAFGAGAAGMAGARRSGNGVMRSNRLNGPVGAGPVVRSRKLNYEVPAAHPVPGERGTRLLVRPRIARHVRVADHVFVGAEQVDAQVGQLRREFADEDRAGPKAVEAVGPLFLPGRLAGLVEPQQHRPPAVGPEQRGLVQPPGPQPVPDVAGQREPAGPRPDDTGDRPAQDVVEL